MISFLTGTVRDASTILVGGVGYTVQTPEDLTEDAAVELYVHTSISETAFDLYGFATAAHRDLFRLLIKAQGVGPKAALNLLRTLTPVGCARALNADDVAALTRVSGIGPKTAKVLAAQVNIPDALLLDLGADDPETPAASAEPTDPLADALTGLGWPASVAARAAVDARASAPDDADEAFLLRIAIRTMTAAS